VTDGVVVVRIATAADVPALRALIPESVRTLSRGYYTPEQIESAIRHVFGVDTQLVEDRSYFVAHVGEALAGCGGWSRRNTLFGGDQMKSGADPLLDPAREPARIRAFFVRPEFARRGVGSRLMEACVRAAREDGFRSLELAATLPGEPLYRAFGFESRERLDTLLPDGVKIPFIRMSRALAPDLG
jgi:GNAT superfamily N-acetyltransferase